MKSKSYIDFVIDHPEIDQQDLKDIQSLVSSGRVLDIGCGSGSFLELLRKDKNYKGEGIDLDPETVALCRKKGLAVAIGDGQRTRFAQVTFSVVRAKEVIEHLLEPEKLIKEIQRVLKPNGYLIIHTPTEYSPFYPLVNFWDDYTHVRPFTKRALKRLLEKFGFKIVSIKGYTVGRNPLENIITRPLGLILPFEWRVIANKIT